MDTRIKNEIDSERRVCLISRPKISGSSFGRPTWPRHQAHGQQPHRVLQHSSHA